ncbi:MULTISPECIES: chemotaxis protein CheA [Thiorhodovibrio]|uniref:chemotaxis protein CheA n=1 Tax=Thiorhodovibrio TaxID=61593 RepID=UPI001914C226|nr:MULTISPECIES: chemotaxis protein CheA [Thiorhodovibrio]MBK5968089.1 chemotaxis protein CheA [Thiorhodovibrio winogradskyi]WPL11753.1 Chemotaxis protein CheA [Thiorhodovibrio litoralis]
MNPLLEQFLSEARDFLQGISEKLMELENAPGDAAMMNELFRLVHTLKGNSGLFDFPEMTRVLHAGEDLMDAVRNGRVAYSQLLADRLLDAMDFVGMLCDEVESDGVMGKTHGTDAARLGASLRELMQSDDGQAPDQASGQAPGKPGAPGAPDVATAAETKEPDPEASAQLPLAAIPEAARMEAYRRARAGDPLHWLVYTPSEQCFYQGDDPFFLVRQTPELLWGGIEARDPWSPLAELDAYACVLDFSLLTAAPRAALEEHYRYVADQIRLIPVARLALVLPQGDTNGGPVYDDFLSDALELLRAGDLDGLARNAGTMLELSNPDLWIASALRWLRLVLETEPETEPESPAVLDALLESLRTFEPPAWDGVGAVAAEGSTQRDDVATLSAEEAEALEAVVATQRTILSQTDNPDWLPGRIQSVAAALSGCLRVCGDSAALPGLDAATGDALEANSGAALLAWLDARFPAMAPVLAEAGAEHPSVSPQLPTESAPAPSEAPPAAAQATPAPEGESGGVKFGRRAEDAIAGPKSLKVDQTKIDRLMNLIGEMVVAKNGLPYLAGRAEDVFGVRELSRDIKGHYAVINRIAEEMQDAIMQVRMMPVSFVFQRFPRLVRDISRKLGKDVHLVMEGEDTEADKNIIEALGDPLVHIVRNSLDHGFESPEVRAAAGKPVAGTLTLRATQESDRVVIEIKDDGKGIDPDVIKHKAYTKGLIDEATLERISDQEAVNLVFAAGLSTAETVSDLSGRGVGMDVVRSAVEKVNGAMTLTSVLGQGTQLRLSVPLSMAVTNVMIVVSDDQSFGVPMDTVVETVRVPQSAIRTIKRSLATVLRGRIVPLKSINTLLGIQAQHKANADDELAVLVVRLGDETLGLLVDDFRETVDIILKPMTGVLASLSAYAGSALMGDGSVLMVLNVKEIL